MSYAVLRMQKFKQPDLKGIQFHNQRERESQTNMDIDPERTKDNYDLIHAGHIDYNQQVNGRIEEGRETKTKVRKDAVRVASFLVSSDQAFFDGLSEDEEKRFFETSLAFFQERYGKENIAYAMVHKDEKTPHMHVGLVPLTSDGRLSAKDYFGKPKQLVQLQDDYAASVKAQGFDLERGVSSDKKHIEERRFKALTAKEEQETAERRLGIKNNHYKRVSGELEWAENQLEKISGQLNTAVEEMNEAKFETGNLEKLKEQVGEAAEELQQKQAKIRKVDEQNGQLENIDQIVERAEPKKKMFKDVVEMPAEDFERFKQVAEHGVRMEQQIEPYRQENAQLKQERDQERKTANQYKRLWTEKRQENDDLQKKYDEEKKNWREQIKEMARELRSYDYLREFVEKMYGKMKGWVQEKDQSEGRVTKDWEDRLPRMKREAHEETREETGLQTPDAMKEEGKPLAKPKQQQRNRGMEL